MSIVVTTNEPRRIRELFKDKVEVPMGFDFLIYTNRGPIPIERKTPGDLVSSVSDGRLKGELSAMRNVSSIYIVLIHGKFKYTKYGELAMRGHGRKWTKRGVKNLLRTIQLVEGAFIEYAESDKELVDIIYNLQEYFDKTHHLSLKIRAGLSTNWLVPVRAEKVRHFYQGLPKISAIRARELEKVFPNPMGLYEASVGDLAKVSGFGPNLAKGVYNFLREG